MITPCFNCEHRRPPEGDYPGCHAVCEAYKNYNAQNEARRAERYHGYVSTEDRGKRIKQQIQRDYRNRRRNK